jgi:hypothetical protein
MGLKVLVTGVTEEADQATITFTLRKLEPFDSPVVDEVTEIRFSFEDNCSDGSISITASLSAPRPGAMLTPEGHSG